MYKTIIYTQTISTTSLGGSFNSTLELAIAEKRSGREVEIWANIPTQHKELEELADSYGIEVRTTTVFNFAIRVLLLRLTNNDHITLRIHSGLCYVSKKIHLLRFLWGKRPLIWCLHGPYDLKGLDSKKSRTSHLKSAHFADALVVPSESERQKHTQIGISPNEIFVVGDIVRLEHQNDSFDFDKINKDKPIILFLARLVAEKGCINVIKSIDLLEEDAKNCTLIIAGDGPERDEYEKLARSTKLNIIFTGHIKDIKSLFEIATIFVAPSIAESFGRTAYEGALSNTPMILSDIPPWNDFFEDEIDCLFANPNSPLDISKKIHDLLKNPTKSSNMAQRANEKATHALDNSNILSQLKEVYDHAKFK